GRKDVRRRGPDDRVLTRAAAHLATAFEEDALVDDQAMRVDVAFDMRAALQLDLVRRVDVADDLATNDGVLDVDVCLDDPGLPDHQRVRAVHHTLELGVDAQGALDIDGALELAALAQDRVEPTLLDGAFQLFPEHQRTS